MWGPWLLNRPVLGFMRPSLRKMAILAPKKTTSTGTDSAQAKMQTFGFGISGLKKYPELIPITVFITGALLMGISFGIYALATKPDVQLVNRTCGPPWEKVKPTEIRKLRVANFCPYRCNPELQKLRCEIGRYNPYPPCKDCGPCGCDDTPC